MGPLDVYITVFHKAHFWQTSAPHGLQLHQYADDCRVHVSAPVDEASASIARLSVCVTDIARLLSATWLRLNPTKTALIWLGSLHQVEKVVEHEVSIVLLSATTMDIRSAGPWHLHGPSSHEVGACQLHVSVSILTASCASYIKSCDRCHLIVPRQ